jgi:hypothetical protein
MMSCIVIEVGGDYEISVTDSQSEMRISISRSHCLQAP